MLGHKKVFVRCTILFSTLFNKQHFLLNLFQLFLLLEMLLFWYCCYVFFSTIFPRFDSVVLFSWFHISFWESWKTKNCALYWCIENERRTRHAATIKRFIVFDNCTLKVLCVFVLDVWICFGWVCVHCACICVCLCTLLYRPKRWQRWLDSVWAHDDEVVENWKQAEKKKLITLKKILRFEMKREKKNEHLLWNCSDRKMDREKKEVLWRE